MGIVEYRTIKYLNESNMLFVTFFFTSKLNQSEAE